MDTSSRRSTLAFALLLSIAFAASPAWSGNLISFKDDATVPHELILNGQTVGAGAILNNDPPAQVVAESTIFGAVQEDLDAIHLMSNGHYLLSTATASTVDGVFYLAGDIFEFDPDTGTASEFFDVNLFGSTAVNVDAVYLIEGGPDDGNLILSTTGNATLGGLTFRHGDLVKYDPDSDTATIFFDQDEITGTLSQKNIEGLHVTPTGDLIITVAISNGTLGGVTLESSDLIRHTPGGATSVEFDGEGLFDGVTASFNAIGKLPAPVPALSTRSVALLIAGLAMITVWMLRDVAHRRRGRAR